MIATAVFLVLLLQSGENPVYSIITEVQGNEQITAFEACHALIDGYDPNSQEKEKLACIEINLHDQKHKPIPKEPPPKKLLDMKRWS